MSQKEKEILASRIALGLSHKFSIVSRLCEVNISSIVIYRSHLAELYANRIIASSYTMDKEAKEERKGNFSGANARVILLAIVFFFSNYKETENIRRQYIVEMYIFFYYDILCFLL